MSFTKNDLFTELKRQALAIFKKGGIVQYNTPNPSLVDITKGIESIQPITISGNNYSVQCTETANTTFTVMLGEATIDSKTNDSTIGGSVIFNLNAPGVYTIIAVQNSTEKWRKNLQLSTIGFTICKSPLSVNTYSEEEIDLAAKNNYAKFMWEYLDYKDDASFVGSTNTHYTRRFIVGFNEMEKADGTGPVGIIWAHRLTPASYKWDSGNSNSVSWEGCELRYLRCLPNNTSYYRYDNTVNESTTGTYYIFDTATEQWYDHILPDEYIDTEDYYAKNTTTADGTIYAGINETTRNNLVKVKVKTWRGYTKNVKSSSVAASDRKYLISEDYVFVPSGQQLYGDRPALTSYLYWGYQDFENEPFGFIKETNLRWYNVYAASSFSLRSPSMSNSKSICYWTYNYGGVSNDIFTNTNRPVVCYCQ